jgi:UDP-glucose 4-epimerase
VVVIDNLSTGLRQLVAADVPLIVADIGDTEKVRQVLRQYSCDAIAHFAGSVVVPESVSDPLKYYHNNTINTHSLIKDAIACNVRSLLFSSTAAVYGYGNLANQDQPIREDAPKAPINPYGSSKMMSEIMLQDVAKANSAQLNFGILRYFNVAGADPKGRAGQSTPQATHLIKVACEVATQTRDEIAIFGTDYPTKDGTGVRDYIHVTDLVHAHVLAMEYIQQQRENIIANCGYGHGFSVREVISTLEKVSGNQIKTVPSPRRAGDPAALIANSLHLQGLVGWKPSYDNLELIIKHALWWEKNKPL